MNGDEKRLYDLLCVWGYPLVRCLELREKMTQGPATAPANADTDARSAAAPLGQFGHQKLLSDPSYRVGVAPNVDTLYSVAWVDLAQGDLLLETPDFGDRYYAFQFGYFDTTCDTIGQRTHGARLGPVTITWSSSSSSSSSARSTVETVDGDIRLTTGSRFLMIAGRIMVDGSSVDDLAAVHALQGAIRLRPVRAGSGEDERRDPHPQGTAAPEAGPGRRFFASLARVLADVPEAALDPEIQQALRAAGWQPGGSIGSAVAESELDDIVSCGLAAIGHATAGQGSTAVGEDRNGWMVNYRGVDFGRDWMLRASVAMTQIFINPAEEALYPVLEVDGAGRALDGGQAYVLRFAAGDLPPVMYFWSLTMYHAAGLLVENPICRYAIGDRSGHLRYEADGSLELVISHEVPAEGRGNWLPAPADGFRLMLRLYGPTSTALRGEWSPPALVRI